MDAHIDGEIDLEMDGLLRRSMAAPAPVLSRDFDRRLLRKIRKTRDGAGQRSRFRRNLFAGYGLVSVAASAVVMHGQGLEWTAIALAILCPLALVGAAPLARRVFEGNARRAS
jgi:hypothetical protein